MSQYHFYYPIQVRYSDVDAQGHVNNSRFASYIEQARMAYLVNLGLWDGVSFLDLGLIVADVHIAYLAPIQLWQKVRVGIGVTRMGNKSMDFEYQIEDEADGSVEARGSAVMVYYDYRAQASAPIPENWREKISAFESIPLKTA